MDMARRIETDPVLPEFPVTITCGIGCDHDDPSILTEQSFAFAQDPDRIMQVFDHMTADDGIVVSSVEFEPGKRPESHFESFLPGMIQCDRIDFLAHHGPPQRRHSCHSVSGTKSDFQQASRRRIS